MSINNRYDLAICNGQTNNVHAHRKYIGGVNKLWKVHEMNKKLGELTSYVFQRNSTQNMSKKKVTQNQVLNQGIAIISYKNFLQ